MQKDEKDKGNINNKRRNGKITPEQSVEIAILESLHPIFCHLRQKALLGFAIFHICQLFPPPNLNKTLSSMA